MAATGRKGSVKSPVLDDSNGVGWWPFQWPISSGQQRGTACYISPLQEVQVGVVLADRNSSDGP